MKEVRNYLSILFVIFFLFASNSFAQETGYFVFQSNQGEVQIISQNKSRKVVKHTKDKVGVNVGDFIRTAKDTNLKLYLEDERYVIDIYPKTLYKMEAPKQSKNSFSLFLGKALFVINKVVGKEFEVKTKFSTVGVKGTTLLAGAEPVRSYVLVTEGIVSFTSTSSPDATVLVSAGQYSETDQQGIPIPPIDLTDEQQNQIIQEQEAPAGQTSQQIPDQEETKGDDDVTPVATPEDVAEITNRIEEIEDAQKTGEQSGEYVDLILSLDF